MLPVTREAMMELLQHRQFQIEDEELFFATIKAQVIKHVFPDGLKVTSERDNKNGPAIEYIEYIVTNPQLHIQGDPKRSKLYDIVFDTVAKNVNGDFNLYPRRNDTDQFIVRSTYTDDTPENPHSPGCITKLPLMLTPIYERKLQAVLGELEDTYTACLIELGTFAKYPVRDTAGIQKGMLFYTRNAIKTPLSNIKGQPVVFEMMINPLLDKNNHLVNCIVLEVSGFVYTHTDCLMTAIEVEEELAASNRPWHAGPPKKMDDKSFKFFDEAAETLRLNVLSATEAYNKHK